MSYCQVCGAPCECEEKDDWLQATIELFAIFGFLAFVFVLGNFLVQNA